MALPNFRFYYWAANLSMLQSWLKSGTLRSPPMWLQLEAFSSRPVSLPALLHCPLNCSSALYTDNIIVKTSLQIWNQFKRHFGLQTFSISAPLTENHVFPPSLLDNGFNVWANQGIKQFKDLYIDNTFGSFQELVDLYDLPRHHFFRYLQTRSFACGRYANFPNVPGNNPLDKFLVQVPVRRGIISYFYNLIYSLSSTAGNNLKGHWEEDLGMEISEDLWSKVLSRVHSSSVCARHGLIQCKVVHRTHWTKARLARIYENIDPTCEKCHQTPVTHAHMFWSCASLNTFWTDIFATLTELTGMPIEPNPMTALFGISEVPMSRTQADLIAFVTLLARRLILMKWKSPTPPSHTQWIRDIFNNLQLEKIRYTLRGSVRIFHDTWDPFLSYAERITFSVVPE